MSVPMLSAYTTLPRCPAETVRWRELLLGRYGCCSQHCGFAQLLARFEATVSVTGYDVAAELLKTNGVCAAGGGGEECGGGCCWAAASMSWAEWKGELLFAQGQASLMEAEGSKGSPEG